MLQTDVFNSFILIHHFHAKSMQTLNTANVSGNTTPLLMVFICAFCYGSAQHGIVDVMVLVLKC